MFCMLCLSSTNKGFHQCIAKPADCQASRVIHASLVLLKKHQLAISSVINKTQQVSGYIIIAKWLHLYAINCASN